MRLFWLWQHVKGANVNIIRLYADPAGESNFVIDGLHMSALGRKRTFLPGRDHVRLPPKQTNYVDDVLEGAAPIFVPPHCTYV